MDNFAEQLVTRKETKSDKISRIGTLITGSLFSVCLALLGLLQLSQPLITMMFLLLAAAGGYMTYLLVQGRYVEYEYTFTNGSLDFAMVYNNKRRKNLGALNVAKVDAFGKVQSGSFHRHVSTPNVKQLRWFLNREAELYYFAFSKEGKKSVIVFEPSEVMVDMIKHYVPRGVYQEN